MTGVISLDATAERGQLKIQAIQMLNVCVRRGMLIWSLHIHPQLLQMIRARFLSA
jgi:hypothetical protein